MLSYDVYLAPFEWPQKALLASDSILNTCTNSRGGLLGVGVPRSTGRLKGKEGSAPRPKEKTF